MRTDLAKGIDEVAVILRIEKMTWMLTLFGILFHAMISVCRRRKGTHDAQVCIASLYNLYDVAHFKADSLFLTPTIPSKLIQCDKVVEFPISVKRETFLRPFVPIE